MMGVIAVRLGIGMSSQVHSEIRSNTSVRESTDKRMPQTMKSLVARRAALACPWGNLAQDSRLFDDRSKLI